jgi:uncharacterized protein (DUF305 family)
MRLGRWGRSALTPSLLVVALSVAIVVGAMATRADGKPSTTSVLTQEERVAVALTGSMCTSIEPNSEFQRDMNTGMERMMTDMHSPGYSGNVDVDFLAMMVPHHQGAVDMARLVLIHGRDPATRMLAEEIIAGQTIEIQSMQRRLVTLRQPNSVVAENEFPVLGGTRGP